MRKTPAAWLVLLASAVALAGCSTAGRSLLVPPSTAAARQPPADYGLVPSGQFPLVRLPPRFRIEKVAQGLTYPTSVTWDDRGRMYVAEAGGAFMQEDSPARILRVDPGGQITEVVDLTARGIGAAVAGVVWHRGAFYITHRAADRTGAVSRVAMDGRVTQLFSGIIDSQTDHQLNDIRVGPDGRMYVASGAGGNSGVMDQTMIPAVLRSPQARTTACRDIVLAGQNFLIPDFRTRRQDDMVLTGAFVPFGTQTQPGQVIRGTNKCGGAILVFDPENAEATLRPYAWGFRNVIGMAWNGHGEMFAAQNGYDGSPGRPVKDPYDPTYRVREGAWYGAPDFSAALEPLTEAKFNPPASLQAPIFVNGQMQEKRLGFLIDHAASDLTPPDRSLVLALHEVNSSPSKPDVAPGSWGDMAGQLFVPEWGDMAWFTNALRSKPAGNRIVRIDTRTGRLTPFVANAEPGPASELGAPGMGIERPFDVKFGPDGAMYIVDFGMHRINQARIAEGKFPFEWPPGTGVVWRITRQ